MFSDQLVERFSSYVALGGCGAFWTGSLNRKGYGKFNIPVGRNKQTTIMAHRFAWQVVNGPLEKKFDLHHKCEDKTCLTLSCLKPLLHTKHAALENQKRIAAGAHNFLKGNETDYLHEHRVSHGLTLSEMLERDEFGRWLAIAS